MTLFDIVLIQPVFNILVIIYSLLPGQNFGLALIVFTVLVRMAMWPLVKKQLHQTKIMRQIQPELAKIKQKAKGNRQMESQLMMELYRERGINPFGSIGLLLLQIPIFIALYSSVHTITEGAEKVTQYTYDFLEKLPGLQNALHGQLDNTLFGVIDLTKTALHDGLLYWPLFILAIVAAIAQFVQSRQLLPQPKEKRRLRDLLKDQAQGKQIDQAEASALMTSKISWLFPVLTFVISIYLAGALVLYLVVTSVVAIIQQHLVLKKDEGDLEKLSEKTKGRAKNAKTAEVVVAPKSKATAPKSKRRKR